MKPILRTLVLAAIASCSAGTFAGAVEVRFVNPTNFTDAGNSAWDEKDNLNALARYLQDLGRELLPESQTLRIEVLDVDLAGTVRDVLRTGARVRELRGGADWPRIKLRYTLEADGHALGGAEETVSDLDYLRGHIDRTRDSEPLYYEKRMLDRWFLERFTGDRPPQTR